jgi:hypothetical protein
MRTAELVLIGGGLLIGGYFVYKSISKPTDTQSDSCSGDWTDYINPACWLGGAQASFTNATNTFSNELNTVLIILAIVVVAVVALLAFGPGTEHIGRAAALFV